MIIELLPSSNIILLPTCNVDGSTFDKFIEVEPALIGSSKLILIGKLSFDVFTGKISGVSNFVLSSGFVIEKDESIFCIGYEYTL